MREDTIAPSWTDIVRCRSQSGARDNIDLKGTWFTPNIEEDTNKNPIHVPIIATENKNQLPSKPHIHESPARKGASASEFHESPVS